MFFIITTIILITGILLLRKNKITAGYATLILGWLFAVVTTVFTSTAWDAGFSTFFLGLAFIAYVQWKMKSRKKP